MAGPAPGTAGAPGGTATLLLLDSSASQDEAAAERTARATLALIESRSLLGQPSWRPGPDAEQEPRKEQRQG